MTAIILTRPKAQAERFAAILRAKVEVDVIVMPLMQISMTPTEIPDGVDAVIFTSANAVAAVGSVNGRRAFCVGQATADAAKDAGFEAVHSDGDAQDLARLLAAETGLQDQMLFHPHGAHVTDGFHSALRAADLKFEARTVYEQKPAHWSEADRNLLDDRNAVFPVFSPNSARHLAKALSTVAPASTKFVAISSAAAAPLTDFPSDQIVVTEAPTRDAMIKALLNEI